jgi:transporter family-2 protein
MFITYAGGGVVVGLMMLAYRGGNLAAWRQVPWYALTAGLQGDEFSPHHQLAYLML